MEPISYTGLHERGFNDVLAEGEPAHAERPGQHGAEPAELVAKKVLHQRTVRSFCGDPSANEPSRFMNRLPSLWPIVRH